MIRQTILYSAMISALFAVYSTSSFASVTILDGNKDINADTTIDEFNTIIENNSNERWVGIGTSKNYGPMAVNITDGVTLSVIGNQSGEYRFYGVAAQKGSTLTINGNSEFILANTGNDTRGIRANGGDVALNGNATVTATSTSNAYGVDAWDGGSVVFNGTSNITTKTNTAEAYGAYADGGSSLVFNGDATITVEGTYVEGVRSTQGDITFKKNTLIDLTSSGDMVGINAQSDPGVQHGTIISFNGNKTTIKTKAEGNLWAVSPSGGSETEILFSGNEISVIAESVTMNAYGLQTQYGSSLNIANPKAQIDVTVSAPKGVAVGVNNTTYGGDGTVQFGEINVNGNIDIQAEGSVAYGVLNNVDSTAFVDISKENEGIHFSGNTTINVKSTDANGSAVGVYSDNTDNGNGVVPESNVSFNQLVVNAEGTNGALAVGIHGTANGSIQINGNSTVVATGDNAIGLVLENSALETSSSVSITGDTLGISMSDGAELNANNGSHITTNTINSTGTSNLAENTVLTVTGGTDTSSSLGTVNANSASIELGSGSYDISTLTGDKNSLVLTDLSNTETVAIQTKSGRLAMRATGASNDQYDNAQAAANALSKVVEIETDNTAEGNTLAVEEGAVNNGLTAKVDANGNLSEVAETKNTKLDALGSVSALSAMTLRHEMNSLSKRMGELRDAPAGVGTWARYYGSEMEYGAQNLTSKNNTIQIGSDYTIGDWKVGVAANYTDGESSYDNGSADNKNYGFAVYGTWFVPCGAYVDLIAKYSRMDNDFALNGMNGSYENNAFNVSAETGYRFEFMDGGLFVEPQVGVSYGRIMGDDFTAQNGVRVEQDDYDSLIGRVGVRTGFKFPKDKGLIYARVSGLYDFQGEMNATTTSGSARNTIEEDLGGAWLELGVGANFNWTDNTYSYIDIERTNGGDVKENYRFNVGIRHTF